MDNKRKKIRGADVICVRPGASELNLNSADMSALG